MLADRRYGKWLTLQRAANQKTGKFWQERITVCSLPHLGFSLLTNAFQPRPALITFFLSLPKLVSANFRSSQRAFFAIVSNTVNDSEVGIRLNRLAVLSVREPRWSRAGCQKDVQPKTSEICTNAILNLYVNQGKSLSEVIAAMNEQGFKRT